MERCFIYVVFFDSLRRTFRIIPAASSPNTKDKENRARRAAQKDPKRFQIALHFFWQMEPWTFSYLSSQPACNDFDMKAKEGGFITRRERQSDVLLKGYLNVLD